MACIDRCPHCQLPLQIICVRFRWKGTAIVSSCPNCAEAAADEERNLRRLEAARKLTNLIGSFQSVFTMMNALNSRLRNVVVFVVAALILAGLLRHVLHVYGGIAPAEMRWFTLILLGLIVVLTLALTARHSRE
jgi:hypothetical protein